MRLDGKVALVTGAASGIGRATAERFVEAGAKVACVGRNAEDGAAIAGEIGRRGPGEANFFQADLGFPEQLASAVQATVERWGRIDVLVSNAATMTFEPVIDLSQEAWDRVLAVNLRAAFLLAKHAIPHMPKGSAIVNVSSVHAQATTVGVAAYAASKGGLEAFTRALSIEVKPRGIRVNAVRLGAVDTPMLWSNPNVKSGAEKIDRSMVGSPGDIAAAILFLASPGAAFVTGSVLEVDGGRLARLG